ncbi:MULTISPECIES: 1,4-alpha-glucan branching protein GlgB [Pseudoalteromonas]|uniref:1,4-alpha-glucan branching enzyme GlgB n=1 Tax=Pseudoalteromonas amylolytica TaxID=1859457 RepID=A0A1S1N0U5_9GAMM|nr:MULTISPECIES: 1,4-alpha-glucan branching protein GlgB [Pseudoalteromonas]OHU85398.1 1,4-alpha-glucan branching enzyme [Pseudoalteromonas sp. JW3]OHU92981.1 1,4-alpha-glucan branching enzyme [Pseudoalteromonas amylolytica]
MNSVVSASKPIRDYSIQLHALQNGCFSDPFSFLGLHLVSDQEYELRVYLPGATSVSILIEGQEHVLKRYLNSDLYLLATTRAILSHQDKLCISYGKSKQVKHDVYRFGCQLDEQILYLFNEGTLEHAYQHLGAHFVTHEGIKGVRFAVWAPNAQSVSVIGDFNCWQRCEHFMRLHPASGVWEIFIPELKADQCYKYSIVDNYGNVQDKADPFAFKMQQAPGTASILQPLVKRKTITQKQQAARAKRNHISAPVSIYEVHLGSWKRRSHEHNRYLTYRELADDLVPYVCDMGFTHLQLMPISEYPFDGSWGYQPVGLFAPTSRFGSFEDFVYFVERCHDLNLGLLIDWVPGHFPSDPHGLHKFDGTHLFEHADARQGFHPDWNTYIYNYDRPEVKSFLLANAMYWLDEFKLDGLRVDAVASMLYLDYSRKDGEWVANKYGGRENLGAIDCLQQVNKRCYGNDPSIMMVAEESTAWPGVTNSVDNNGLGFGFKWNMGWMNDSLGYMSRDPIYRQHHHHEMTFSMAYAYSENYILPLSHDEVVHGKGSLLSKMPGDDWQQFANLRAYFAFMYAHPGKKLLFMGSELAPRSEWDHNQSLDWGLLAHESHAGIQKTVKKLNEIYTTTPALYECDNTPAGFQWIDCNNAEQSLFSFARFGKKSSELLVVICHLTPQVFHQYRIGVPRAGVYEVVLNTDDKALFGSGVEVVGGKQKLVQTVNKPAHGFTQSIEISIPALATVYLRWITG